VQQVRVRGYEGAGTRARAAGKRVRVQRVFSKKKNWPALLKPVSVYPSTRLYPGTGTCTAGTGHGYTVRVVPGGF
jgi:hypothetical protein